MAKTKEVVENIDTDKLLVGGPAFHALLSQVNVASQIEGIKKEVKETKSPSKKDDLVKKLKYLGGLQKSELKPQEAFIIRHIPVAPPTARPTLVMGNNSIEYAAASHLYKDHMVVNESMKDLVDMLPADQLTEERKNLYDGAKAIFGLGEAISGASRGKTLKGYIKQISGNTGPKQGFFHSKLLSKKQDFSARGTIYAEPNLGFNEAAIPEDMLWQTHQYHILRDLTKNGYDYVSAKKAVLAKSPAAIASFNKVIKQVPVILNRAPTLMRTNITAHWAKPIKGQTIGVNPLMLPMYAGDFDGDALSVYVPQTPEAVKEAIDKLLPDKHINDYRIGLGASIVQPGHEAIIGSVYMTEPDTTQKTIHFKTEEEALAALKAGLIKENTPLQIG